MLSINEIKEHLKDKEITDEKVKEIRELLYGLADLAIDVFEADPVLQKKALSASAKKKLSPEVALKIKESYS